MSELLPPKVRRVVGHVQISVTSNRFKMCKQLWD